MRGIATLPFGTASGGAQGGKIVTGTRRPAAGLTASGGGSMEAPGSEARPVPPEPVLPEQSREDTDIAWGDYPSREDDRDRLDRDRPPHWADY